MAENNTETIDRLNKLFGSYKAEWLNESIYDLFTEPTYFPELTTSRPCFLLGGRGMGKTTTLMGLSYRGYFAFKGNNAESIPNWAYFGIFYRVNTNRVSAFTGPEVSEERWIKLFSHYLNLVICGEIAKFLAWYTSHVPSFQGLPPKSFELISKSLQVGKASTLKELLSAIDEARITLEAVVNTVADDDAISLSLRGAPIDLFIEQIKALNEFATKQFFLLIDEYENFEDYQQRVVNTLIKHSSPLYSFKVGVRELGFRCRTTLNLNEQLVHPSDYVRVNIGEKLTSAKFAGFAERVCRERLKKLNLQEDKVLPLTELFPTLTPEEEAMTIDGGLEGKISKASRILTEALDANEATAVEKMPLLERYFIVRRAELNGMTVVRAWNDFKLYPAKWKADYRNHQVALLFTLGTKGTKNPKLYCGWKSFTRLSHSNIRYLLELVDQAIHLHLSRDGDLAVPIDPTTQTEAAYLVAKKNLSELEGLSVDGARITKLLLGLGRIFHLLATSHYRDNPEVTQFCLPASVEDTRSSHAVDRLLTAAVNHLALVRFRATKLAGDTDTRGYDYMIHPIYSPFFVISYRLKRKITLNPDELLGLVDHHKKAIADILEYGPAEDALTIPIQLELFKAFYESDK